MGTLLRGVCSRGDKALWATVQRGSRTASRHRGCPRWRPAGSSGRSGGWCGCCRCGASVTVTYSACRSRQVVSLRLCRSHLYFFLMSAYVTFIYKCAFFPFKFLLKQKETHFCMMLALTIDWVCLSVCLCCFQVTHIFVFSLVMFINSNISMSLYAITEDRRTQKTFSQILWISISAKHAWSKRAHVPTCDPPMHICDCSLIGLPVPLNASRELKPMLTCVFIVCPVLPLQESDPGHGGAG